MPHAQRILITNYILDSGTGTEMYVYDLALRLLDIGRLPVVYCPRLGMMARRMQNKGITVVECIDKIGEKPDLIHGHHTLETLAAAIRFPDVPAIFVSHDCTTWHDTAPKLANIRRYVGVDQACYDRLVFQDGVSADIALLIPNGVHLGRFPLRKSLPVVPRSLLCFGSGFQTGDIDTVRRAVPELHVESIRARSHRPIAEPGPWLAQFDIVLARGRSAREAIATGASTIVADGNGIGDMVTTQNYQHLHRNNFGRRLLRQPLSIESIRKAVNQYDSIDATRVATEHRVTNNLDNMVTQLTTLYDKVLNEGTIDPSNLESYRRQTAQCIQWASLRANIVHASPIADAPPPTMAIEIASRPDSSPMLNLASAPNKLIPKPNGQKRTGIVRIYREFGRAIRKLRKKKAL